MSSQDVARVLPQYAEQVYIHFFQNLTLGHVQPDESYTVLGDKAYSAAINRDIPTWVITDIDGELRQGAPDWALTSTSRTFTCGWFCGILDRARQFCSLTGF